VKSAVRNLVVIGAALVVACAPLRAADSLPLDRFRDYLEALRVQSGIPGLAAAIVGTNDIIWAKEFGQQNVERSVPTRTDTPFQLDAITQVVTATMALQCVEEGRLSLDARVGQFRPTSADANLTIRQLLTHTSGTPDNLIYSYRPDRLAPMWQVIRACTTDSYRETASNLLNRLAMVDSVPGLDIVSGTLSEGVPSEEDVARYKSILGRLATPYVVDAAGHANPSQYAATTLTPSSGLISTVNDYAEFDLALKNGILLRPDTIAQMWQPPTGRTGVRLPHGIGWFVQSYNGETIVWQFGTSDSSSSLTITVPARGLTLILLANSNGLVKPFDFTVGDVTVSPYAKLFLGSFIR
jgi:CubicO group peptidase (beta-lactamase class C family)